MNLNVKVKKTAMNEAKRNDEKNVWERKICDCLTILSFIHIGLSWTNISANSSNHVRSTGANISIRKTEHTSIANHATRQTITNVSSSCFLGIHLHLVSASLGVCVVVVKKICIDTNNKWAYTRKYISLEVMIAYELRFRN